MPDPATPAAPAAAPTKPAAQSAAPSAKPDPPKPTAPPKDAPADKAPLYQIISPCALHLSPGDLAERSAFAPKANGLADADREAQTDANIARLLTLGAIAEVK